MDDLHFENPDLEQELKLRNLFDLRTKELIESEESYLKYLHRLRDAFKNERDFASCFFGNFYDVIHISEKFLGSLYKCKNKDMELSESLSRYVKSLHFVYKEYCVDYDENIARLRKIYETDSKKLLEERLNLLRKDSPVGNLESILIMPVQRIMRYPMLLAEIVEVAEKGDEKNKLNDLLQEMKGIVEDINEEKLKQEMSEVCLRSNASTVARISSVLYDFTHLDDENKLLSEPSTDFQQKMQEFNKLYEHIRRFFKKVKKMEQEMISYSKSQLSLALSIQEYVEDDNPVYTAFVNTSRQFNQEVKTFVEKSLNESVTKHIDELISIFEEVDKLIKTRESLLMEFKQATLVKSISQDASSQYKVNDSVRSYSYVQLQLSNELPVFLKMATELVLKLGKRKLELRKKFLAMQAASAYKLAAYTGISDSLIDDIEARYEESVRNSRSKLDNFAFVKENKEQSQLDLTASFRRYEISNAKPYTAICDYEAKNGEIRVTKGEMIYLIKKKGDMSKISFGDNVGFVPTCILRPYNQYVDKKPSLRVNKVNSRPINDKQVEISEQDITATFFSSPPPYESLYPDLPKKHNIDSNDIVSSHVPNNCDLVNKMVLKDFPIQEVRNDEYLVSNGSDDNNENSESLETACDAEIGIEEDSQLVDCKRQPVPQPRYLKARPTPAPRKLLNIHSMDEALIKTQEKEQK
ncbi:dynamin-binding protein-like isoform X2 [Artemia franciscana]|uniref:Uncharacterized protein n=3 Tax=Artemia franciscana TaxID=6661 RepID=A0AA88H9Q6_ARTSF|nr:hypothetical protein QYM36_016359 [Artemia franciscana]KAK2706295.1 hypothetical protein QYM36_016359 [Artemia franciscana]